MRGIASLAVSPPLPALASTVPLTAGGPSLPLGALIRFAEEWDAAEREHAATVADLSMRLARQLGCDHDTAMLIGLGGRYHDVGKFAIPAEILYKPGPLDPLDKAVVQSHPVAGSTVVAGVPGLQPLAEIIRSHHERWDGAGYPAGLVQEEIPLGARIIAVADAYSAITAARPYSASLGHEQAVAEIARCAGSQFDPAVVAALAALPWPPSAFAPVALSRAVARSA